MKAMKITIDEWLFEVRAKKADRHAVSVHAFNAVGGDKPFALAIARLIAAWFANKRRR